MKSETYYQILAVAKQSYFLQLIKMVLKDLNSGQVLFGRNLNTSWKLFCQQEPNVCIIEVELDRKLSGITLGQKIRARDPHVPIIFLTDLYNEETYQRCLPVCPSSFLNKDLSRLSLRQAIELSLAEPTQQMEYLSAQKEHRGTTNKNFFLKTGDVYQLINLAEVSLFCAKGKIIYAKTKNRNILINVPMKRIEEELFPEFIRIHKTYIVNCAMIEEINLKENLVKIGHDYLPIGHLYRKNILIRLKLLK